MADFSHLKYSCTKDLTQQCRHLQACDLLLTRLTLVATRSWWLHAVIMRSGEGLGTGTRLTSSR